MKYIALTNLCLKKEGVYVKKGEVFSFDIKRSEKAIQNMISCGMIKEIEEEKKVTRTPKKAGKEKESED